MQHAPETQKAMESGETNEKTDGRETRQGATPGSGRRLAIMLALIASLLVSGARGETVALIVLLLLVLLHEAGHFAAARAMGMRVEEFFVGFGPVVWSYARNGIEYGIKSLPLGGYVKIAGMSADDLDHPKGYQRAGRWRKLAVVAAGPATNIAIALLVAFCALFFVGLPKSSNIVERIDLRLGAAAAGIQPGDEIIAIGGRDVLDWSDVGETVLALGVNETVEIVVMRGGRVYKYDVKILADAGQPRIGVGAKTVHEPLGFIESAYGSVIAVGNVVTNSLRGLVDLGAGLGNFLGGLTGAEVDPKNRPLSPIGAVQIGAQIGGEGLFRALELVMVYSTFLAIFNLLPVLPLDGGRIAIVIYEAAASAVQRKKVEVRPETMARIGFAFTVFILFIGLVAIILDITQPVLQ
jgi:membrane-associated protease RseP (regulator of RpoE activity)